LKIKEKVFRLGFLLSHIPRDLISDLIIPDNIKDSEVKKIKVDGLTDKSQDVKPNYIFFAISGTQHDGHNYLNEAVEKGASALVTEKISSKKKSIPIIITTNSRLALSFMSSVFYKTPSQKLSVCGITGTNGKTTTSFMSSCIFEKAGINSGLLTTVQTQIGNQVMPSKMTTPEPPHLYALLEKMVEAKSTHVIMEVSSHSLEQERVSPISFNTAVFTNITHDHLDLHQDFSSYINTKSKLLKMLDYDDVLLFNGDDPQVASLINNTKAETVSFGINEKADIQAEKIRHVTGVNGGLSFNLSLNTAKLKDITPKNNGKMEAALELSNIELKEKLRINLQIRGNYNIYNALAAAGVAMINGIQPEIIKSALEDFTGVKRRMEIIYNSNFKIIDDFAHNPGGLKVVLETVSQMNYNNLIIVYALRGSRGVDINRKNAKILAEQMDKLEITDIISTLSKSHVMPKDQVSTPEQNAYLETLEKGSINNSLYPELDDALLEAVKRAVSGDIILLLGAQGMDPSRRILEKLIPDYNEQNNNQL